MTPFSKRVATLEGAKLVPALGRVGIFEVIVDLCMTRNVHKTITGTSSGYGLLTRYEPITTGGHSIFIEHDYFLILITSQIPQN